MNFCEKFIGKPFEDVSFDDLTEYFKEERDETDYIEFKSLHKATDKEYEKIYKTVAAFLNSAGGFLIWGAPKKEKNKETYSGPLTPIQEGTLNTDTVNSKITGNIFPLPSGVRARVIDEKIVIVEVQTSTTAHMTDNTYYMRLYAKSEPAPPHYVQAIMTRVRFPEIECYMKINEIKEVTPFGRTHYNILFTFGVFNKTFLVNEKHIKGRISTNIGEITFDTATAREGTLAQVLHFGQIVRRDATIAIPIESYPKQEELLHVTIVFEGDTSPMKQSEYWLKLPLNTNIAFGKPITDKKKLVEMIANKRENKLVKELRDEEGLTYEKWVKMFLDGTLK